MSVRYHQAVVSTATHIASDLLAELTHQEQIYHDISQNLAQMHDEFVSLEKQLREPRMTSVTRLTEWIFEYFVNAHSFFRFAGTIDIALVTPATSLREELSERLSSIETRRLAEKSKYEKAQKRYHKSYSIYVAKCLELEEVGRAQNEQAVANGNVGESELLREEKGKCYELERVAYEECHKFSLATRTFDYEMEKLLIEIIEFVQDFRHRSFELTREFANILSKMSTECDALAHLGRRGLQQLKSEEQKRENDEERRVISGIVDQFSQLPVVNLDIFSYLGWRQVFQAELSASYFAALEDIIDADGTGVALKSGEICKGLSKKGTLRHVEKLESGIRVWVPKSKVKKRKDFVRTVFRVKEDLTMENRKVLAGQYVLLMGEIGKTVLCRSATGETGEIPIEKLDAAIC